MFCSVGQITVILFTFLQKVTCNSITPYQFKNITASDTFYAVFI